MHIVIVFNRAWNRRFVPEIEARTGAKVTYLEQRDDVSQEKMTLLSPDWFFSSLVLYYSRSSLRKFSFRDFPHDGFALWSRWESLAKSYCARHL